MSHTKFQEKAEPGLPWCVVRVNDDGRRIIANRDMCALAAELVAGALRDSSTDREVGEGWNYLPAITRLVRARP